MGKSLRNIRALVARDLADAARNPTVLMSCVAGALLTAFVGKIIAGSSQLGGDEAAAFAAVAALSVVPAFSGAVVELYVMAEEREHGVCLTLAESGVAVSELAFSKWFAATCVTLVTEIASCVLLGYAPLEVASFVLFAAVAVQPLLLIGLACGLLAREQMSSSVLAVPITLIAVAPMLSYLSGTIRAFTWFWPLGPAAELLGAGLGVMPMAPVPVLVVCAAAWTVATGVFSRWACRRFAAELAAERERRL